MTNTNAPENGCSRLEGKTPKEGIRMNTTTLPQTDDNMGDLTLVELFRFSTRLGVDPRRVMSLVPDNRSAAARAITNIARAADLLEEVKRLEGEILAEDEAAYVRAIEAPMLRIAVALGDHTDGLALVGEVGTGATR